LAISYNDGGAIAMINLCGGPVNTATFRLRAQIYAPVAGSVYTQVTNSGGEESAGLSAGWNTIDVPFGANEAVTELGVNVNVGGTGVSGTIYIESLEMYRQ
jgi:hypothetical protein